MKNATCALMFAALILTLAPAAMAALPTGKVAVVTVTSIDGLAHFDGKVTDTRSSVYSYDGTDYTIDGSALSSVDGVETLVLVSKRTDTVTGGTMIRQFSQEARALRGTHFEVTDLPNRVLDYQVAMIGGNLRLTGAGDQILCESGKTGPYHIWRVDGIDLIDRSAIHIR